MNVRVNSQEETDTDGNTIGVRKDPQTTDPKEKNANTCDSYAWDSNGGEYLVTITLNKDKTTTNKKTNLLRIYKILIDSGIKFLGLKMVGLNRAEVAYKSKEEANNILEKNRLRPEQYSAYIPHRWKYKKGIIYEWHD